MSDPHTLRDRARRIWQAAVDAVRPADLIPHAFTDPALPLSQALQDTSRIIVVGGGKAGAAMSVAVEQTLADRLDQLEGIVNVPADSVRPLRRIRLHPARPAGSNFPTEQGVAGSRQMLDLVRAAGPDDLVLCLLSGGGSALLPLPAAGVTLQDKQQVTKLLHHCGASINEMNAVRKHLSDMKGGRLAQACSAKALFSLIISDVVGDPLDVIASGPTAADPTTFADALAILERFQLMPQLPANVRRHLEQGATGHLAETLKTLPQNVQNILLGNNARALRAAQRQAEGLGYRVLNLGSFLEGETQPVAVTLAGVIRSIRAEGQPVAAPVCVLSGGETTVTLGPEHGRGGRNQEFVLAVAAKLGMQGLRAVVVLSGGTDGEDGPTDAAGALADSGTLERAERLGLSAADYLARHDAYPFFEATGDLLLTGLTETNVMDVRVLLVGV